VSKRSWAMTIKRSAVTFLVVALVGIAFDYASNEPGMRSPLIAVALSLGAYLLALSALGILHAFSGLVYLWCFGGRDLEAAVLDHLRQSQLPTPSRYHPKNFNYLAAAADDDSLSVDERLKAAVLLGSYTALLEQGLFRSLALRRAIDTAVLRFSQEAPERRERWESDGD